MVTSSQIETALRKKFGSLYHVRDWFFDCGMEDDCTDCDRAWDLLVAEIARLVDADRADETEMEAVSDLLGDLLKWDTLVESFQKGREEGVERKAREARRFGANKEQHCIRPL